MLRNPKTSFWEVYCDQKTSHKRQWVEMSIVAITVNRLRFSSVYNKKAELSQRWPRDAPYVWAPENFQESLTMHTPTFPEFLMGFCSDWAHKCARKIWNP